jgi:alkylphosphonate utilization operon protein PhnA
MKSVDRLEVTVHRRGSRVHARFMPIALSAKGSSSVVKVGTKVKNIRLVEGDHDIDCKIDGIGSMGLKSEFVKKA